MAKYTEDDLASLRLKADVAAVAEELGISSEGTRKEITARILSAQDDTEDPEEEAPAVEDVGDAAADETEPEEVAEDEEQPEEVAEEEEPVRASDDSGRYSADDEDTQPDEAYSPPVACEVTDKAKLGAKLLVESYFGKAGTSAKMLTAVEDALAVGYQPCIVNGKGNTRFNIRVFDTIFDRQDVSKDASRKDGVVLNIARRLAHSNLYPK